MNQSNYNVKLTGMLINGSDQSQAIAALAKMFKLPIDKAQALFARAPVIIKKNVDEAMASKIKQRLNTLGLECDIEAVDEPISTTAKPPPSLPTDTQSTASVYQPTKFSGHTFKIEGKPDYAFLTVQIPGNETLKVEGSAMATMDTHVSMKTKMKGGFSRLLTGESLFINEFTADNAPGEISIAPGPPGDMEHQYLDGQTLFLQNSAFVASGMGVNVETKWQGLVKGFFSGENLFLIRCSGKGDLWFNTYGAMISIDVDGEYIVDTGNIVAFTENLDYKITKVGGYKSFFFSGEGFVCRFSGKGRVWIQTRGVSAFASWASMFRPAK